MFCLVFCGVSESDSELASRTLEFDSKRLALDVKENNRGRFVKIAELNEV